MTPAWATTYSVFRLSPLSGPHLSGSHHTMGQELLAVTVICTVNDCYSTFLFINGSGSLLPGRRGGTNEGRGPQNKETEIREMAYSNGRWVVLTHHSL
jgi:hypothetical protein